MSEKISLDIDNYEPSDSEEEYTQRERSLITKVRGNRRRNSDSDQEVLGFDDELEESDNDQEFDGIEQFRDTESEEEGDGLPDSRAWGKKKRAYYNTDFVDPDYSSYTAREEELALQEAEEAKNIQQRLAKQLQDADFSLDVFTTKEKQSEEEVETRLKADLSDLSERQKKALFKKDSPEFDGLMADFFKHLEESEQLLKPILEYCKENQPAALELPALQLVETRNKLILNYCSNVAFYLMLKAKRVVIKHHPIVKRLFQMRQLIGQLDERFESVVRPQLEQFVADLKEGKSINISLEVKTKSRKLLNIMKPFEKDNRMDEEEDESAMAHMDGHPLEGFGEKEAEAKRKITYQIAKNKGLTPHKKREMRNPRVKNKNRYQKAVKRRKGAVRPVRQETTRYGGEATGIKAFVKRSISIK